MAATVRLSLHSAAIGAMLRSDEVQAAVEAKANEVAERARGRGILVEGEPGEVALPITVEDARTGRARALVLIAHPSGLSVEAKHRLLVGSLG